MTRFVIEFDDHLSVRSALEEVLHSIEDFDAAQASFQHPAMVPMFGRTARTSWSRSIPGPVDEQRSPEAIARRVSEVDPAEWPNKELMLEWLQDGDR